MKKKSQVNKIKQNLKETCTLLLQSGETAPPWGLDAPKQQKKYTKFAKFCSVPGCLWDDDMMLFDYYLMKVFAPPQYLW